MSSASPVQSGIIHLVPLQLVFLPRKGHTLKMLAQRHTRHGELALRCRVLLNACRQVIVLKWKLNRSGSDRNALLCMPAVLLGRFLQRKVRTAATLARPGSMLTRLDPSPAKPAPLERTPRVAPPPAQLARLATSVPRAAVHAIPGKRAKLAARLCADVSCAFV